MTNNKLNHDNFSNQSVVLNSMSEFLSILKVKPKYVPTSVAYFILGPIGDRKSSFKFNHL